VSFCFGQKIGLFPLRSLSPPFFLAPENGCFLSRFFHSNSHAQFNAFPSAVLPVFYSHRVCVTPPFFCVACAIRGFSIAFSPLCSKPSFHPPYHSRSRPTIFPDAGPLWIPFLLLRWFPLQDPFSAFVFFFFFFFLLFFFFFFFFFRERNLAGPSSPFLPRLSPRIFSPMLNMIEDCLCLRQLQPKSTRSFRCAVDQILAIFLDGFRANYVFSPLRSCRARPG